MIKIASLDDIDKLMDVVYEWGNNYKGKEFGLELDINIYLNDLKALIENEYADLFLLLKNDNVVGYMGAHYYQSLLGNQLICNEHYWYVMAMYRGRATMPLLTAIMKWAKEKGCSHLKMNASNLASGMHNKLCKFYERIGFKKYETTYIKKIS